MWARLLQLWAMEHRLSSCDAHTGLVALWYVGSSRFVIEPMSPALAGGFFITEPSGRPLEVTLK